MGLVSQHFFDESQFEPEDTEELQYELLKVFTHI